MSNTAFHHDVRGYAVNVKTHGMHWAEGGTEKQRERAWNQTQEDWWRAAGMIAIECGFHDATSCGRMGGWCAPFDINKAAPENHTDRWAYVQDDKDPRFQRFAEKIEELLDEAEAMFDETLAQIVRDDEEDEREAEAEGLLRKSARTETLHILESTGRNDTLVKYWRKQWGIT